MAQTSVYEDKSLRDGQIRVLCLHPGDFEAPLQGHLDVIRIEDARACQPDLQIDPWNVTFNEDERLFAFWKDILQKIPDVLHDAEAQGAQFSGLIDSIEKLRMERQELVRTLQRAEPDPDPANGSVLENIRMVPDDLVMQTEQWIHEAKRSRRELRDVLQRMDLLPHRSHLPPPRGPSFNPFRSIMSVLMIKAAMQRDALVRESCSTIGYEAVSYAWGPPTMTHRLWLEETNVEFAITSALHEALRHLRYKDRVRRLWVDAICINQRDVSERTRQVANMGQIFASAVRVLAWLGREEDRQDTLACAAVANSHIRRQFELLFWSAYHARLLCEENIYCSCCGKLIGPYSLVRTVRNKHTVIGELIRKAWFTRLWVVQEMAMARYAEVICGHHSLPWDAFVAATRGERHGSEFETCLRPILRAKQLHAVPYSPGQLLAMLVDAADKLCSDPRDRLFAIQSVVHLASTVDGLHLSYVMSTEEIYTRVAAHCLAYAARPESIMKHRERQSVLKAQLPPMSLTLALIGTERDRGERLPSWVPNFHSLTERSKIKAAKYARQFYHAETERMILNVDISTAQLQIQGSKIAIVDSVLHSSQCAYGHSGAVDPRDGTEKIYEWFRHCRRFAKVHWPDMDSFDIKFKELLLCVENTSTQSLYTTQMVGDNHWLKRNAPSPNTPAEALRLLAEEAGVAVGDLSLDHLAKWTCESLVPNAAWGDVTLYDRDRHLAMMYSNSMNAYLGWVPRTAEPGDTIVTFVGAPHPFLLRAREGDSYQLLGDCWIHGHDQVMSEQRVRGGEESYTII